MSGSAPENDFLVFAGATGANVLTQAQYAALSSLTTGVTGGTASSAQANKTWRQSSIMASMLAKFIVDQTGASVIDDGTLQTIENNFAAAVAKVAAGVSSGASGTAGGDLTGSYPNPSVKQLELGSMTFTGMLPMANLKASDNIGFLSAVQTCSGDPTGKYAGNAASSTSAPSMIWDTSTLGGTLWVCVTTGSTSTAVWKKMRAGGPVPLSFNLGGPSQGTFTIPNGSFYLEGFGTAGGGGGAGSNTPSGASAGQGGGGGGAGDSAHFGFQVSPGDQITYQIGAGGAAGSAGNGGGAGGNTTITYKNSTITIPGGGGGNTSIGIGGSGGYGGAGSAVSSTLPSSTQGLFINPIMGGDGGDAYNTSGNSAGNGGASFYGGGSRAAVSPNTNNPQRAWGSGGGGGYTANSTNNQNVGAAPGTPGYLWFKT